MNMCLRGLVLCAVLFSTTLAEAKILGVELGGYAVYQDSKDIGEGYGGATLKLRLIEFVSVSARASYVKFDDFDVSMTPVELVGIVEIPILMLRPYIGLGAGYYFFNGDDVSYSDEPGIFPLLGFQVNLLKKVGVFVEGRYLFLESDRSDGATGSATLDGLGVNLGLSFLF